MRVLAAGLDLGDVLNAGGERGGGGAGMLSLSKFLTNADVGIRR